MPMGFKRGDVHSELELEMATIVRYLKIIMGFEQ